MLGFAKTLLLATQLACLASASPTLNNNKELTGNWPMCVPAPTKVSIKRTPTEKRADSVKTPLPTQPGMVDSCDTFCYVQKDNTCVQIAESNHITTNQFTQWNKGAGPDCLTLWAYTYVCVGVMKS
ncbi:LysM domain-containing protein [Metarhizium brunneum]